MCTRLGAKGGASFDMFFFVYCDHVALYMHFVHIVCIRESNVGAVTYSVYIGWGGVRAVYRLGGFSLIH